MSQNNKNNRIPMILAAALVVAVILAVVFFMQRINLSSQVDSLQSDLAVSQTRWQTVSEEKEALQSDLTVVNDNLREAQLSLEESAAKVEQLDEQVLELTAMKADLEVELTEAQQANDELNAYIATTTDLLATTTDLLETTEACLATTTDLLESTEACLATTTDLLADTESMLTTTTDLLTLTEAERDELQNRVAELTAANEEITAQLAELTAASEAAAAQLKQARIEHRETLQLLKGHLQNALDNVETALAGKPSAAERTALEKEQSDLIASLNVVTEQLNKLNELIGE